MKILATVALLVVAAAPVMAAWEWPPGLREQLDKAHKLQAAGRDSEAIAFLNSLVTDATPLAQARIYAAIADVERDGDHRAEARSAYEKALALNSLSPAEQFVLTQLLDDEYFSAGDHERGRTLLQAYLKSLDATLATLPAASAGGDVMNSREAIGTTRARALQSLAAHDEAQGRRPDAIANLDAAIVALAPNPARALREEKIRLSCSGDAPADCVIAITQLARVGHMRSSKADELDLILERLADDPTVQLHLEVARNAGFLSADNKIAARLPPGYVEPQFLVRMLPAYPQELLEKHISGSVAIDFQIDPDGTPTDAKIIVSEPPGVFDSVALDALLRWKYVPAVVDGKRVAARTIERMVFRP